MNRAAELARLLEAAVAELGDLAAVCHQFNRVASARAAGEPPFDFGARPYGPATYESDRSR